MAYTQQLGYINENDQRNLCCSKLRAGDVIVDARMIMNNSESVIVAGAISVILPFTSLTSGVGVTQFTLAAGVQGQRKVILLETDGGGNAQINVTGWGYGAAAATNIVMDDAGDMVELVYRTNKWFVLANHGCAIN